MKLKINLPKYKFDNKKIYLYRRHFFLYIDLQRLIVHNNSNSG